MFLTHSLSKIYLKARLQLFNLLPIKRNCILFISHLGKNYSCNPKYICEYISKYHSSEHKLLWVYDRNIGVPKDLPSNVIPIPFFSTSLLYYISTVGTVISNTRISRDFYFKKRKGQKYIQTWHSSLRLKKIEKDANLGLDYENFAKYDSSRIDVIISGCEFSSNIFRNSFWYDGAIANTGTPRIDYLLNIKSSQIDAIYSKAKLSKDKHYLLYAPTFRNGGDTSVYNIDAKRLTSVLQSKFGGNWTILFKLHPNIIESVSLSLGEADNDVAIDFSRYDDIQELLCISDILITDYSSCMFDFAFMKKTCLLYASDLKNYCKNERGLYFDVNRLPFPIATNNDDLAEAISNFDKAEYHSAIEQFLSSIGSFERGNACEQLYDKYLSIK